MEEVSYWPVTSVPNALLAMAGLTMVADLDPKSTSYCGTGHCALLLKGVNG